MRFEIFEGSIEITSDVAIWGWYWHLRSRNNRITAIGGEAYSSKSNVRRAIRRHEASMAYGLSPAIRLPIIEVPAP